MIRYKFNLKRIVINEKEQAN